MTTDLNNSELQGPTAEAAAWLARKRVAPLSADDAAAFRDWLRASPENMRAWRSMEKLWTRLDDVREAPAILQLREAARSRTDASSRKKGWAWGAAVAAGFALGMFAWQMHVPLPDVIRVDAASALLAPNALQVKSSPQVRDVDTRVGERAFVRLADGSAVTLNTDSAIHVDFSGVNRNVTLLHGEAYFEVAKNPERRFVVSAGGREIVAVGTAFNVKLTSQRLQVALVEGKVRIERRSGTQAGERASDSDATMLEAGSSLVAESDGRQHVAMLDLAHDMAWREGKLVFQGDRLADVVAEMNRYSMQKLEIGEPQINDRLLSGVFDPSGTATLARTLESYGMARIVEQTGSVIVLGAPINKRK